ncbi:MAG: alpha/beta hydrolase [Polaromonas sp.]|nr:alpha/beta hydrolase [Polaromonas sp.]
MSSVPVWRHYDQAALDRQYDSRGTVADAGIFLRAYAEQTRRAKINFACMENLKYGSGTEEKLDIYRAAAAPGTGFPVMVFLHGGDWRFLSKEEGGFAAPAFVSAGVMFVALDFRLVPSTTLPAMGEQVRRALHWLYLNVAAYGGDANRLHIAGHSSGANLVGQLLMTDWSTAFHAPADLIKSAVMISGLGDLEPVRLSFRNQQLHLTPADVDQASLQRRTPGTHCPLLVVVGECETNDYRLQSRRLADFWHAQGNQAQFFELKDRHHFDALLEWGDPASAVFSAHIGLIMGENGASRSGGQVPQSAP